jgi:hypothetical protein
MLFVFYSAASIDTLNRGESDYVLPGAPTTIYN